jgi:hypothetical protein
VSAKITCPQNHESETTDFCSVCGVEIVAGSAASSAPAAAPAATGDLCPDCGTPRENARQVFCEVCRYNFQTRAAGVPVPKTAKVPLPATPKPAVAPPSPAPPGPGTHWELEVRVDLNLYGTPNADAPTNQPPQSFSLFDAESMIGRAGTEVRVQVPIHGDAGVSRRQALLIRKVDGSLTVRDAGSANGTQVNGVELVAGVDTPLKDGDTIAVGAWTRITVRAAGA